MPLTPEEQRSVEKREGGMLGVSPVAESNGSDTTTEQSEPGAYRESAPPPTTTEPSEPGAYREPSPPPVVPVETTEPVAHSAVVKKWLDEGFAKDPQAINYGQVSDIKGNLFNAADLVGVPDKYLEILRTQGLEATTKAIEDDNYRAAQMQSLEDKRLAGEARQGKVARQTAEEFARTHVIIGELALPIDEWNKLDPKYQTLALRDPRGLEAVVAAQKADIARKQGIVNELEQAGYKVFTVAPGQKPTPTGNAGYEVGIDVIAALQAGFDRDKLVDVFGEKPVIDAEQTIQDLELVKPYESLVAAYQTGAPEITRAASRLIDAGNRAGLPPDWTTATQLQEIKGKTDTGAWQNIRTGETYTDAQRKALIAQNPVMQDELVRVGKGITSEGLIKNAEALGAWQLRQMKTLEQFAMTYPTPLTRGIVSGAAGFGSALATLPIGMAILTMKGVASPRGIPSLAKETVQGLIQHISTNAVNIFRGRYGPYGQAIAQGNLFPLAYDTVLSFLVLEGAGKVAKGVLTKITTYVAPRGMPFSLIGKEASTGRIKTPDEFAEVYADANNKVLKLATTKGGEFTGEVPIEGTTLSIRYLKTPLQQVMGDVLFHGTKDEFGKAGELVKESALRLAEREGQLTVGEGGVYTSPWAAVGYTRGGENPGLLMIITDAAKIKSGAKGLAKGLTQSDKFIREAEKGFYGSSKTWRGDLETEIVGAPGTRIEVPLPTADLLTRILVGKYSDFFTSDGSRFVPIKIGLDARNVNPLVREALNNPANLRAVKLWTLYNALRDTSQAFKHPDLMLKDVSGTFKELLNIERYFRRGKGTGGMTQFPGVRDAYLITNWGKSISEIVRNLYEKAFRRTKQQLGDSVREGSKQFRDALEGNREEIYRANADALIRDFDAVARAYATSEVARSKFEASYLANLGLSMESLAKSSSESISTTESLISDLTASYPESARSIQSSVASRIVESPRTAESLETMISEVRTPSTETPSNITESPLIESLVSRSAETRETPTPLSSIVSPITETPRTPTETTTETPRTPPTETVRITTPPPPVTVMRLQSNGPTSQPVPQGSIAFAMGKRKGVRGISVPQWYYIPPPYNTEKPISLSAPPMGAIRTDSVNPYETIQMIGRSRTASVPQSVSIDLGITDAFITDGGRTITFKGKGAQTDIGTRLPSNTVGMSLPSAEDIMSEELPPVNQGVNRVTMSRKQPRRKTRRLTEDEYMTTLKGFRL